VLRAMCNQLLKSEKVPSPATSETVPQY
jgi:hypothetical protein